MSVELDNLKAAVASIVATVDIAVSGIKTITERMIMVKNDPSMLQTLADELNARSAALRNAITENAATLDAIVGPADQASDTTGFKGAAPTGPA